MAIPVLYIAQPHTDIHMLDVRALELATVYSY